jgi:hypothetical protein
MNSMSVGDFYGSKDKDVRKHYFSVRKYLNVHELVAVGIRRKILNEKICFDLRTCGCTGRARGTPIKLTTN